MCPFVVINTRSLEQNLWLTTKEGSSRHAHLGNNWTQDSLWLPTFIFLLVEHLYLLIWPFCNFSLIFWGKKLRLRKSEHMSLTTVPGIQYTWNEVIFFFYYDFVSILPTPLHHPPCWQKYKGSIHDWWKWFSDAIFLISSPLSKTELNGWKWGEQLPTASHWALYWERDKSVSQRDGKWSF